MNRYSIAKLRRPRLVLVSYQEYPITSFGTASFSIADAKGPNTAEMDGPVLVVAPKENR